MYFIFSLLALLCWSGSDFFSKRGTTQQDKQSQWKVVFFVGVIMGIHAVLTILLSLIPAIKDNAPGTWWGNLVYTDFHIMDFVNYLPVAFILILAMVCGYVGLRYIELSISSPICNSSGSLALILCIVLGISDVPNTVAIISIAIISVGIIALGFVSYYEDEETKLLRTNKQNFKYTKSFLAILLPILYMLLDALGTVGDEMIAEGVLFNFEASDYALNTAFEFTMLGFAIFAFIWVKLIKKEKFFNFGKENSRYLAIGGICETIGQIFYMAVIFSDFTAGIPMISAYCAVSVLWGRIFLKEKLSWKHYVAIGVTIIGITLLGVSEIL